MQTTASALPYLGIPPAISGFLLLPPSREGPQQHCRQEGEACSVQPFLPLVPELQSPTYQNVVRHSIFCYLRSHYGFELFFDAVCIVCLLL